MCPVAKSAKIVQNDDQALEGDAMKSRTLSLFIFIVALLLDYGTLSLLLGHLEYWKPLGLTLLVLFGITWMSYKAYKSARSTYVAFVGSERAWLSAKFELRYNKLKWIRKVDDLNGEIFTDSYCLEQDVRRYKVLHDAVKQYIEHTKGR